MVQPDFAQVRPDPTFLEGRSRPPGLIPFILFSGRGRPAPIHIFVVEGRWDGSGLPVLGGMDGAPDPLRQSRRQISTSQLPTDNLAETQAELLAFVTREACSHMVLEVATLFRRELAVQIGVEAPQDLCAINHGPGHAPSSHQITVFPAPFFLDEGETSLCP